MQETVQEAARQDDVPEDMQANEGHVQGNVQGVSQVPAAISVAFAALSTCLAAWRLHGLLGLQLPLLGGYLGGYKC